MWWYVSFVLLANTLFYCSLASLGAGDEVFEKRCGQDDDYGCNFDGEGMGADVLRSPGVVNHHATADPTDDTANKEKDYKVTGDEFNE